MRCPHQCLPLSLVIAGILGTTLARGTELAPPAERPAVTIALEDQFRNRRATEQLRGDVVVLVYAERHGAEAALELGRRLHLRFHPTADGAAPTEWSTQPVIGLAGWPEGVPVPDVHVIPIACVPEVPKPLHAVARMRLRQESPHVSVWLDFDDVLRQTFGLVPAEPNVALIDADGRPAQVTAGQPDERRFQELVAVIERLRGRVRPDRRAAALPSATGASATIVPATAIR
jgi:hypothetical protein